MQVKNTPKHGKTHQNTPKHGKKCMGEGDAAGFGSVSKWDALLLFENSNPGKSGPIKVDQTESNRINPERKSTARNRPPWRR
jgi:hypothetical protein